MTLIYITNGNDLGSVISKFIRKLNKELNAKIKLSLDDSTSMRRTRLNRYLIDHEFLDFEGDTINDDTINAFINRIKNDDTYFDDLKSFKPNSIDQYDSFIRDQLTNRFKKEEEVKRKKIEKNLLIEENIKKAREAVDKAIELMKSDKVLLRPLPPTTNKIPQRYADVRFNNENYELSNYLNKFGYTGFKSHDDEYLCVNEPHEYDKAIKKLVYFDKYDEESIKERRDKDNNRPIVTYYFNKLKSLEDVFIGLETIFKTEIKPFKINILITGVFETPKDDNTYEYEVKDIKWWRYKSEIPIIVRLPEDIDKVKLYIESRLHDYETSTSNTKLTIISTISFTVSRMIRITGRINLPKILIDSKSIIADNVDDSLCWYRFLAICLDPSLIENKNNVTNRTNAAKKLLLKKHGIEYTKKMTKNQKIKSHEILTEFKGVNLYEMKEEAKEYELNIRIYDYITDINKFNLTEQWKNNESNDFHSAVLFVNDSIIHIMYIKPNGVETLTNLIICPFCLNHVETKNHKDRMEKHKKKCELSNGEFNKKYINNKNPLPYCPHILSNPVYEYCLAHGLEWKPTIHYITYDFETMEHKIDKSISESSIINSKLIPISVSSCVKLDSGLITKNFDIRVPNFIEKWIDWLFERALDVYHDKLLNLKSFIDKTEKELRKIDPRLNVITVFGYNSSRFDSNLFKEYFNYSHWCVEGLIGSISSLKQFILSSSKYSVKLRFIDAQSFVSGGSLKQFGIDFGGIDNSVKGVFPYEIINDENYDEVLSKKEPFEYNDFYSYLNQCNPLSKADYELYLEDYKRFNNRWDYLIEYNNNDVEMMIKPIDNLIRMNAEYKVDLINNLSLSKNASAIKYALAYKDFNINEDYNIINHQTTFKPNNKWWEYKCDNYRKQDEKFNQNLVTKIKSIEKEISNSSQNADSIKDLKSKLNRLRKKFRNINECVNENDFNEFMKRYESEGYCYLCGEYFTFDNRPTLDRIDNDIGHTLLNCKFSCKVCNVMRNRKDPLITRLRIQIKKFCLLNHLPTLITDEYEYHSLRENITGGMSNVLHRMNIRGETLINKLRFDGINNRIISEDTSNIVSHIMGIDFNSLYPSSFSSVNHEFNKYHGGIMYLPGSFIKRYDVYENGIKNKKLYDIAMDIIKSKNRFNAKPKYLFKAEVKLKCPKNKINYFINLPPVFRKISVKNDENTIGSYMYEYMKSNKMTSIDKDETYLTMLLDSCDRWMVFSNYYLWWLIDHGLEIVDIKNISLYDCHNGFKPFVEEFMRKRQDILSGNVNGCEKFFKIMLNGSYGFDGMNSEHFNKIKIVNKDKAYRAIISDNYINGYQINEDNFMIQSVAKSFRCCTCLQESFWTLDNSKYWFLVFYYDFLCKCLDKNKFHVNTIETDSYYYSIAGDMDDNIDQGFKNIIIDEEFYNNNYFKFLPNQNINSIYDSKKLLGACVEKVAECQIAPSPKSYSLFNLDGLTKAIKLKGVSIKKNHITSKDYRDVIDDCIVKKGKNINLQMIKNNISKITISKNALTAKHTKMIVLPNQSCIPYIKGLSAKDVYYIHH